MIFYDDHFMYLKPSMNAQKIMAMTRLLMILSANALLAASFAPSKCPTALIICYSVV